VSRISDERWPARISHVEPLRSMGAHINFVAGVQNIVGPRKLHGARVEANDIRCGMALILAGMVAEGPLLVGRAEQVERGYERPDYKFQSIGAQVHIANEDESAPTHV
jgi:UDP-N-acetylglucosamine 1-carboxyvinyltransferase